MEEVHRAVLAATQALQDAALIGDSAITLQGVRQAQPQLSKRIAVIGLGLVGLLTAQLLRANGRGAGRRCGCRAVAFAQRTFQAWADQSATAFAVTADAALANANFMAGRGADPVIIAAATASNDPASAGELPSAKGRVVVVGMVGMDVPRDVCDARSWTCAEAHLVERASIRWMNAGTPPPSCPA